MGTKRWLYKLRKWFEMVGKGKAFGGGKGLVEFEAIAAKQEEQWPPPTVQHQPQQQQPQLPGDAAPNPWSPPLVTGGTGGGDGAGG